MSILYTETMEMNEAHRYNEREIHLSSDSIIFDSSSSGRLSSPCFVFHQHDGIPKTLSYASLRQCLLLHEKWLSQTIHSKVADCGLGTVDDIVVAYISGNSPDMLMSVLACSSPESIPAIPALLNTRWTPSEMMASLRSKKKLQGRKVVTIVLHDDSAAFRNAAQQVASGLAQTDNQYTCHLSIPSFSDQYSKLSKDSIVKEPSQYGDIGLFQRKMKACLRKASNSDALILFTSGTTGGSKGVRLSHRALLVQALAKLDDPCKYSAATAMLATTVPLFHVGGFSSFLAVLLAQGQIVFPQRQGPSSSKFQVQDISKSLRDPYLPSNTLVVVPAMLSSFFDAEDKAGLKRNRFPKARLLLIGGQSASREILEQCRYSFPNARIVQTYACTEAASSMTFLRLTTNNAQIPIISSQDKEHPNGVCVGIPPSHVELRLCRKQPQRKGASGVSKHVTITKPQELGLIATKGPHVMNGYWERGVQGNITRKGIDNQWFIGSDLGFWDDQGRLCFAGRAKDVVRTGGETVLAREVEQVLLKHPDVAECAIFPRIDRRYGEAVSCAIVARRSQGGIPITIGVMKKWCQQKGLAGYKQPKFLFLVNALPRNSSGKVLKHKLIEKFGSIELRSKL